MQGRKKFHPRLFYQTSLDSLVPKDNYYRILDRHLDLHALIYSDEARTLEYELHKAFADKAINLFNYRKEFFQVTLKEIQEKVKELGFHAEFSEIPEAMEYRESMVIKESKNHNLIAVHSFQESEFPDELN